MKDNSFLKDNFIKLIILILFLVSLIISIFSVESAVKIMQTDAKTVNYVGIIRGQTQRLVKRELGNEADDEFIKELDEIIFQLKYHIDDSHHFATHEDQNLQNKLFVVEENWIKLKDEIYEYRDKKDYASLFNLSEEYFRLTNDFAFETQRYVEKKVEKLISLRTRLFLSTFLLAVFTIYEFIGKMFMQRKNTELKERMYMDTLTGLSNREHCNEIINKYGKMQVLPHLACSYFDLNNLKLTNDTLGHDAGDKLIKAFGKILKDASSPYGFVCRNGGDEFLAMFENTTEKDIDSYIDYIKERVEKYNSLETDIQISFAWGVSYSNEINNNNVNELLSLADKRMYENKAEYKKQLLLQNN